MIQDTVRVLHKATFYLCTISAVAMFFTMLLTVGDVVGRSFLTRPITGTYELSRYFLVVMVLLGIAYAQQKGQHIAVDYFISKLSSRGRFVFDVVGTVLGIVFFALVTWQGWLGGWDAVHAKTVSDTLHIPSYPFEFFIAIGSFFLFIELVLKLVTLKIVKKSRTE